MKKMLIVLLFIIMTVNLAFNASAAESIVYDAVQNGEEFRYDYENNIVLLDSSNVYMAADWLDYKDNYGSGIALELYLKITNKTDQELEFRVTTLEGIVNNAYGRTLKADATMRSCMTGSMYDWDGRFGETEEFYQGTYLIEVLIGTEVVDSVQFDLYISEKTPFVNVVTSTGTVPENDVTNNKGTVTITSSAEEKTAPTESVSEDLGDYWLSFSIFLGGAIDGKGLLNAVQNYCDEIEKATDGHVKFEIYESGMMYTREESYDGLSKGMADIALVDSSYFPEELTLSNAFSLPLQGFDDNEKATEAVWNLYEEYPEFAAEWDEKFKVLQLFTYPETIIKQTGLTDVSEIYEKGTLFGICANKELWDILPAQYQEIIENVLYGKEASMASAEAVYANYLAMVDWYQGMSRPILYPTDPDYAAWKAPCDEYAAKWAEQIAASKGVDGAAFLARAQELYANSADIQPSGVEAIPEDTYPAPEDANPVPDDTMNNTENIINTIYTDANTVYYVQQALNNLGYNCGTPDGMAGNMTRAAVTAYQTDHGLEASGNIDTILLISLGLIE